MAVTIVAIKARRIVVLLKDVDETVTAAVGIFDPGIFDETIFDICNDLPEMTAIVALKPKRLIVVHNDA